MLWSLVLVLVLILGFLVWLFILVRLDIIISGLGRIEIFVVLENLVLGRLSDEVIELVLGIVDEVKLFSLPLLFGGGIVFSSLVGFSGLICLLFLDLLKIFFLSQLSFEHFVDYFLFFRLRNIQAIAELK